MDRVVPRLVYVPTLLLVALLTLSCGGGTMDPPRMLTAISVTPAVAQAPNGQTQVQFVATGTFNEPPITVTPLAFIGILRIPHSQRVQPTTARRLPAREWQCAAI